MLGRARARTCELGACIGFLPPPAQPPSLALAAWHWHEGKIFRQAGGWIWWSGRRRREGNVSLPVRPSRPTPSRFCHPVREVAATRTFGGTLGASTACPPAGQSPRRRTVSVCLPLRSLAYRLGPSTWSYLSPPFLRCSFFKGPSDSKATTSPPFLPSFPIRKEADSRLKDPFCTR